MSEPIDENTKGKPDGPDEESSPRKEEPDSVSPAGEDAHANDVNADADADEPRKPASGEGLPSEEGSSKPTGEGDADSAPASDADDAAGDTQQAEDGLDEDDYDYEGFENQASDGEYPDEYGEDYEGYDEDYEGYGDYEDDYDDYEDDYEDEDEDEDDLDEVGEKKMTLVEHLDELRTRIIRAALGLAIGMAVALAVSPQAIKIINQPLYQTIGEENVITIDMVSPFILYLRISLYLGIVVASPWIFYQIWMFIAAGLYKHERKYVTYAVPFSAMLFISGALFFLFVISPMLLAFFYTFARDWMGVATRITLDNHITFMTNMMLVFGFCFQMPIAVLLLAKMGLVTVKTLSQYRKFVIVGILILAAFVTSPSPLDQIALAIPMWALYEIGILLSYLLVEKKRRQEDEAMGYEPIDDE